MTATSAQPTRTSTVQITIGGQTYTATAATRLEALAHAAERAVDGPSDRDQVLAFLFGGKSLDEAFAPRRTRRSRRDS